MARLLVSELGADVNAVSDNHRWTPLHHAAQNGHVEMARLLVSELGADVNAIGLRWMDTATPAAENGHVEMARLLVSELGADVNAVSRRSMDTATPTQLRTDTLRWQDYLCRNSEQK